MESHILQLFFVPILNNWFFFYLLDFKNMDMFSTGQYFKFAIK